jgi:shikimate 5-dehydrogenase/shikimate kinase
MPAGTKRTYSDMRSSDSVRPNSKEPLQQLAPSHKNSDLSTRSDGVLGDGAAYSRARNVTFDSDASIVVIGVRGVGKSSLGFLAASAYSRRLIESDRVFSDATGCTRTSYRKSQGPAEYHRKHCEVLRRTLQANDRSCVIVCSFADLESEGAKIIQHYAKTHPVVYVTRDIAGIQSYIKVWTEERIRDLIRASEPLLRECSNYEFFNVSETLDSMSPDEGPRQEPSRASIGPFLTLKRAEHDFLKLLRNIVGDHDRGRSHQSAYPLSQIDLARLEFTAAVVLAAEDVLAHRYDLDDAQIGVDAIQLEVGIRPKHGKNWKLSKHGCFNAVSEAFATIRRSTILPVIMCIASDGQESFESDLTQVELLEHCLRLGPEYCKINLSLEEPQLQYLLATRGRTKMIGEFNAERRAPDGWASKQCADVYSKAHHIRCDLVQLTMPADTLIDNFAIHAFQQRMETLYDGDAPPLIAYCTGQQGKTSVCFNHILTPVAPENADNFNSRVRSPLVTARERNHALFFSFVHEPMGFFIYGANVSFSLSPAMHNAAYKACGMRHSYRTHSASTLDEFTTLVREHDFGGAAVVQPFKTKILSMMDVLSPHAKAIGALNTVIPLRDEAAIESINHDVGIFRDRNRTGPVKALYGDNTDWIGIRACIRRGLSPANTVRPHSSGLVCGAGGMARAAIYAMISLGVQTIFVCNRTKGNAEELAEHYNRLIREKAIAELSPVNAANTCVKALASFESEWPKDVRSPTMIVSCIPTQTTDGTPTNFTLPKEWLCSRTGGVVVEVSKHQKKNLACDFHADHVRHHSWHICPSSPR